MHDQSRSQAQVSFSDGATWCADKRSGLDASDRANALSSFASAARLTFGGSVMNCSGSCSRASRSQAPPAASGSGCTMGEGGPHARVAGVTATVINKDGDQQTPQHEQTRSFKQFAQTRQVACQQASRGIHHPSCAARGAAQPGPRCCSPTRSHSDLSACHARLAEWTVGTGLASSWPVSSWPC